jgi:hypothetical protein
MKHGVGTYHYRNGNIYEGEWKKDFKDGNGRLIDKWRNELYEGWFYFFEIYFLKFQITSYILFLVCNKNKVNGKMGKNMAKEIIFFQMGISIWDIGWKIKWMERPL